MKISLNSLSVSSRLAITLFLILLWYGYFLAVLNTRLSVGLNAESIADHYADHSLTKSEAQEIEQKGFAEEEVDLGNSEGHEKPHPHLNPLPEGEEASLPFKGRDNREGMGSSLDNHTHHTNHEPATDDENTGTITPQQIVQLGHIHMLGFSLLFISLGIILSLTGIRELFKVIILIILFLSFGLDIGGLLLVRFVSPALAILTVIGGIGTGICMAVISFAAMYDMWVKKMSSNI